MRSILWLTGLGVMILGLVAALSLPVGTAEAAAKTIIKLLKSAIANATQKKTVDIDRLYIKRITVDQGPTMKRFQPRALGRATMIRKRSSHITIVLDEA